MAGCVSRSGSRLSIRASQSLSTPSHASVGGLVGVHSYSQPLSGLPSASWKPGSHMSIEHFVFAVVHCSVPVAVVVHLPVPLAKTQRFEHSPQLFTSLQVLRSSSILPSQSLSMRQPVGPPVSTVTVPSGFHWQ